MKLKFPTLNFEPLQYLTIVHVVMEQRRSGEGAIMGWECKVCQFLEDDVLVVSIATLLHIGMCINGCRS